MTDRVGAAGRIGRSFRIAPTADLAVCARLVQIAPVAVGGLWAVRDGLAVRIGGPGLCRAGAERVRDPGSPRR